MASKEKEIDEDVVKNATVLTELAKQIPDTARSIYLNFRDNENFTKEDFEKLAKKLSKQL